MWARQSLPIVLLSLCFTLSTAAGTTHDQANHDNAIKKRTRNAVWPSARQSPILLFEDATGEYRFARKDEDENSWEHRRERWEKLSPEEKERIKRGRERFKALPTEEKERIRRAQRRFRELPPDKREELKRMWRENESTTGKTRFNDIKAQDKKAGP